MVCNADAEKFALFLAVTIADTRQKACHAHDKLTNERVTTHTNKTPYASSASNAYSVRFRECCVYKATCLGSRGEAWRMSRRIASLQAIFPPTSRCGDVHLTLPCSSSIWYVVDLVVVRGGHRHWVNDCYRIVQLITVISY